MSRLHNFEFAITVVVVAFFIWLYWNRPDEEVLKQFWSAGTGTQSQTPLWEALGVSFLICEIINAGRRWRLDSQTFNATVWLSFPICAGGPIVGAFVSRYLLSWLNMASPMYFILLTTAIAIPLCILGTQWVIRYGRRHCDELSKMP